MPSVEDMEQGSNLEVYIGMVTLRNSLVLSIKVEEHVFYYAEITVLM